MEKEEFLLRDVTGELPTTKFDHYWNLSGVPSRALNYQNFSFSVEGSGTQKKKKCS